MLRICSRIWQYIHYYVRTKNVYMCTSSLKIKLVHVFFNSDTKTQSVHALSGLPNSQRMLNSNLNLRFICEQVQQLIQIKCQFCKKVNFEIYIADLKATACIYAKLFLLRCVNPTSLPLVRCYSIRPPRRVAS